MNLGIFISAGFKSFLLDVYKRQQYDFFPTLMDLLGMKEEFPSGLPGRSFRRALEGENLEGEAVVVLDEYGPNRMIRTREWKLVHRYPYGPDELYQMCIRDR